MKLDTVELPANTAIHYSGLEGGVSFACGQERVKGDWWSQYQEHVTCAKCKAKLSSFDIGTPQEKS